MFLEVCRKVFHVISHGYMFLDPILQWVMFKDYMFQAILIYVPGYLSLWYISGEFVCGFNFFQIDVLVVLCFDIGVVYKKLYCVYF